MESDGVEPFAHVCVYLWDTGAAHRNLDRPLRCATGDVCFVDTHCDWFQFAAVDYRVVALVHTFGYCVCGISWCHGVASGEDRWALVPAFDGADDWCGRVGE